MLQAFGEFKRIGRDKIARHAYPLDPRQPVKREALESDFGRSNRQARADKILWPS
jgi:hypothetical protein